PQPDARPRGDGGPAVSEPFFRSRWVDAPAGVEELDPAQLAPGFRAGGAHCGLKGGGKTDVGLIVCDEEAVVSSLLLTRNANAETGEKGYADALAMCERAGAALGIDAANVAVAETGTIGVPLPIEAV